jgi:hypothetical protein
LEEDDFNGGAKDCIYGLERCRASNSRIKEHDEGLGYWWLGSGERDGL